MSRTYRKSNYTETRSKQEHINRELEFRNLHTKSYFIFDDSGMIAYNAAEEEYKKKLERYEKAKANSDYSFLYHPGYPPMMYDYFKRHCVNVPYDSDKVIKEAAEEYEEFNRDGKYSETGRKSAFRKHCAADLRVHNRRLSRKILKGEEDWDQKPYPDTYLGKQYIWDYW